MSVARLARRKKSVAPSRPLSAPNPPPSTRSKGPSTLCRRVLPPIERASSFTSTKLGTNRIARASTAAAAGLKWKLFSSPLHSCVWNSFSIAMPTIHASSEITSCTKPRTKPTAAPPISSRNTKTSSAVIIAALATSLSLRQSLTPEDLIHEPAKVGEFGDVQSFAALDALWHPGRLEAELGGFFQPQPGMRHRPNLARQRDLSENDRFGRHGSLRQGGYQRRRNRQVRCRVAQAVTAGDVQIDLRRGEAHAAPRLQHGEDHRQTSAVPTHGRPSRSRSGGKPHDERLDLDEYWPRALDRREYAGPADGLTPVSQEQGRRIRHLGQPLPLHREHADLVGAAEAVLHRPEYAVLVTALALEAQHRIDHMLENARAGDRPVLGDVTDEDDRGPMFLGEAHQLLRRSTNLADRAGRALHQVGMHGLDGIDDQ